MRFFGFPNETLAQLNSLIANTNLQHTRTFKIDADSLVRRPVIFGGPSHFGPWLGRSTFSRLHPFSHQRQRRSQTMAYTCANIFAFWNRRARFCMSSAMTQADWIQADLLQQLSNSSWGEDLHGLPVHLPAMPCPDLAFGFSPFPSTSSYIGSRSSIHRRPSVRAGTPPTATLIPSLSRLHVATNGAIAAALTSSS